MADATKELQDFEEHADAQIAKLALWRMPVRSILSLIYLSADGQYVGTRFLRKRPRNDEVGKNLIAVKVAPNDDNQFRNTIYSL